MGGGLCVGGGRGAKGRGGGGGGGRGEGGRRWYAITRKAYLSHLVLISQAALDGRATAIGWLCGEQEQQGKVRLVGVSWHMDSRHPKAAAEGGNAKCVR